MNLRYDEELHVLCVERYLREMSVSNMRVHGNCMINCQTQTAIRPSARP